MKMKKFTCSFLVTVILAVISQTTCAEERTGPQLFRYKNAEGVPVTTYVLPPEASGKGYEIINTKGDVLETVKPAPTAAEKQAFLDAIEQEKYDKNLMLKYGSLAELMKAQKRKMEEMGLLK